MSVPSHRDSCSTYIWQTNCRDCKDVVFIFGCSCGSVVLFDAPQPPWPLHAERCVPYLIRTMRTDGYSLSQIEALIDRTARYYGKPVPATTARTLAREKYQDTGATKVYRLVPRGDSADIVGTIVNINMQVNLFKRLKLDDNPIGRGLLGKHGRIEYAELTLRTLPDDDTGLIGEMDCLYPLESVQKQRLRAGVRIIAHVRKEALVDGRILWICRELVIRN